jgi:hypothetical protein
MISAGKVFSQSVFQPNWTSKLPTACSFTFILFLLLSWNVGRGQIAAWDFFGENTVATSVAEVFNANLIATGSANLITRGAGATASAGANSFRTVGFQNNGISTSNTDYFQITLTPNTGFSLSLSTIDARFAGTGTYYASPGVTSQFAYSLDGANFTLIGSAVTSTNLTLTQINLSGISALQNVAAGTTITIRYYASGQTSTGGWGFNSPAVGQYGLAIGGSVNTVSTASLNPATLPSPLSTTYGTASSGVGFTASGTNLTANITATAQTGYQVSTDDVNYSSSVSVAGGSTVYVRFSATQNAGTYNNATAVVLSSTGATSVNVTTSAADNIVSTKTLTVTSASANNKIYDGTNAATITGTLNGIVGADDVTLTGTGTFAQTDVGSGIAVTSTSTLGGTKAANYSLTQPTGLSANITSRALTITANDVSKLPGVVLTSGSGSSAFTSSGLAGGETVGSVTITYGSAGAATGDGNTIGIYANQVTPSAATGGTFNPANYTITYAAGSINVSLNAIGDYRTRQGGNWGINTSWEKWDGSSWVACSVGDFPDISTASVTIRSGHTIDNDGSGTPPWNVKNLTVESGAKLWDNAFTGGNSYIQIYGNILCNGTIGDPAGDDISFDIAGGTNCTISGSGSFTATRIRKDASINPNLNTTLTIDMDVRLTWSSSSGTVLYNDGSTSNFNVTINAGKSLRGSGPGSAWGNVAIDGSNFSSPSFNEAGGTITINGTLDIDGILFAFNDNIVNPCSILINNGGILKCRYVRADASGAAGNVLRVFPGGRLNIFGSVDTIAATRVDTTWRNFSTTNNIWDFQSGCTLEYSGNTPQRINGITQCSNFTVSGGSIKTLGNNFRVDGILTLTNGLLTTNSANLLTLSSTATCPGGGSFSSFVNGPMRKEGSAAFRFPVGKQAVNRTNLSGTGNVMNGGYRPISISGMTANSNFLAEYQLSNPYLQGSISPDATAAGLQAISRCEYWDLVRETGTQTPTVTLSWSDNSVSGQSQCNVGPYIISPTSTFVVPFFNGMWGDQNSSFYGRTGSITTPASPLFLGEISWDGTTGAIDNYLKFVIGTNNWQQAPLPYDIKNFKATGKGKVVQLDWLINHNDEVRSYTIERSRDGIHFENIKMVLSRANEETAAYADTDPAPFSGWGYYRLRITDLSGRTSYSAIQKVWMGSTQTQIQVTPKPAKNNLWINVAHPEKVNEMSIISSVGQLMYKQNRIMSTNQIDISSLRPGVYYVRIIGQSGISTEAFIKE